MNTYRGQGMGKGSLTPHPPNTCTCSPTPKLSDPRFVWRLPHLALMDHYVSLQALPSPEDGGWGGSSERLIVAWFYW